MTSDNGQIVPSGVQGRRGDGHGGLGRGLHRGRHVHRRVHRRHLAGPSELPEQVENYHRAFPDMHRELYHVYVSGNIVVVQLALQGTHLGPLWLPAGTLPPSGKQMDAPCCDVFELVDGKIKRFDCYPEGTIILTQLGVLGNLGAALEH